MSKVWLPNMTMTLVRRASARQPRNNFIFRTAPNATKPEIKEYLAKVYGVRATRVATVNYGGEWLRVVVAWSPWLTWLRNPLPQPACGAAASTSTCKSRSRRCTCASVTMRPPSPSTHKTRPCCGSKFVRGRRRRRLRPRQRPSPCLELVAQVVAQEKHTHSVLPPLAAI